MIVVNGRELTTLEIFALQTASAIMDSTVRRFPYYQIDSVWDEVKRMQKETRRYEKATHILHNS